MMRIWYDQEGDFLEITFHDAAGYMRETGGDVYERVDEQGNLLGYALLNFSHHDHQNLPIPLDDYLHQLEDFEDRLARGEIQWQ